MAFGNDDKPADLQIDPETKHKARLIMQPPTFKCHKCGADTDIEPENEPAVCTDCCDDHEYEYQGSAGHCCKHCNAQAPGDWYHCDGDVPLSFSSGRDMSKLGTPMSEMTAARFRAIGKSWGYD